MTSHLQTSETSVQRAARIKVRKLKAFYTSALAYGIVNAGLIVLNLLTTPHYLWFFWPLLGWGIGLLFQANDAFEFFSPFSRQWEERKIREYTEKFSQQNQ